MAAWIHCQFLAPLCIPARPQTRVSVSGIAGAFYRPMANPKPQHATRTARKPSTQHTPPHQRARSRTTFSILRRLYLFGRLLFAACRAAHALRHKGARLRSVLLGSPPWIENFLVVGESMWRHGGQSIAQSNASFSASHTSLPHLHQSTDGKNCWSDPSLNGLSLRGPSFLSDSSKVDASTPALSLVSDH
jgi:hypothetical protein